MATKCTMGGKLMFPGDYLAAEEFGGKDVTLTIKSVVKEELREKDGGSESKWVLTFEETQKKLVLNRKSQPDAIANLYGMIAEEWVGKRLTLYPTTVPSFGQMVLAIRVRDKVAPPRESKADATTTHCTPEEQEEFANL